MADTLEQMFQKQLNNPNELMGQQIAYLQDLGLVPKMTITNELPIGDNGTFSYANNQIKINKHAPDYQNTLAHELQHAVQSAMENQAYGIKYDYKKEGGTPIEQQFADAHDKLANTKTNLPMTGLDRYRSSPVERQAFGTANSQYGGKNLYEGTPHLDQTMATEQAILFDLAQRARKNKPPVKPVVKRDYVDETINNATDLIRSLFTRK
jgi:hypothetical protein